MTDLRGRINVGCRRIEESDILHNVLNVFPYHFAFCSKWKTSQRFNLEVFNISFLNCHYQNVVYYIVNSEFFLTKNHLLTWFSLFISCLCFYLICPNVKTTYTFFNSNIHKISAFGSKVV